LPKSSDSALEIRRRKITAFAMLCAEQSGLVFAFSSKLTPVTLAFARRI
jgi:hypothetical protein